MGSAGASRGDSLWDDEDGFFYDVLRLPDGQATRLKVRSLVAPAAAGRLHSAPARPDSAPARVHGAGLLAQRAQADTLSAVSPRSAIRGPNNRRLLAVLDESKLRRTLATMLDESEFLSPFGIRSISQIHRDQSLRPERGRRRIPGRLPARPIEVPGMFGGNSNWRGPVWFPMNFILIRGLPTLHAYYGDEFTVECPTGSGQQMTLWQVSQELSLRLARIFLQDAEGRDLFMAL